MRNIILSILAYALYLSAFSHNTAYAENYFLHMESKDTVADKLVEMGAGDSIRVRHLAAPRSLEGDAILTLRNVEYDTTAQRFTALSLIHI